MEFPITGIQCSSKSCQQLDFLPINCQHCNFMFCKDHFQPRAHDCSEYKDNRAETLTKATSYTCCQDSCRETSPVEMLCIKCREHFCLAHRHHGCFDPSEQERIKDLEKWTKPKEDFAGAKKAVDEEIQRKLKKSKHTAMANKVQLMRLKGHSVGENGIPTMERRYFLVYYPENLSQKKKESSKGTYVNIQWTVGKVVDSVANLMGVPNRNNTGNSEKLRIFRHSTGVEIADRMDVLLTELFENGTLMDGQSLILEYSDAPCVDTKWYK